MDERQVTEAQARYLEAMAEDCHRILGPGMDLVDLAIDDDASGTTVTVTYRLDGWQGETVVRGETVVEAHAALREALVVDRLKLGFSVSTDPRTLA
jgi:hypothetical protein